MEGTPETVGTCHSLIGAFLTPTNCRPPGSASTGRPAPYLVCWLCGTRWVIEDLALLCTEKCEDEATRPK